MKILKRPLSRIPMAAPALALALLATALVWIQAGPARAAGYDGCGEGSLCLYTEGDGGGTLLPFAVAEKRLDYAEDPALHGKDVVSFRNRTAYWACLFDEPGYGGGLQAVAPGHLGGNLPTDSQGVRKVTPAAHKFAKSKSGCWTGYERCTAGKLCLFAGPSGRGPAGVTVQNDDLGDGVRGNRDYDTTSSWGNRVASVSNRTDRVACFYKDPGYTGRWQGTGSERFRAFVVRPGEETTVPPPYRATFSSHKLAAHDGAC
ncbi:peptidase inhibitor family I36 protein [Streptomyces microflavus]|uniref:peptidase inhibitor family I36 protein n=1 Tax=Streptomyces microflavus TaxID=1919 RepID=UPI0033B267E4